MSESSTDQNIDATKQPADASAQPADAVQQPETAAQPAEADAAVAEGADTPQPEATAAAGTGAHSRKKKVRPVTVILSLVIVACLVGAGFGIAQMVTAQKQIEDAANTENVVPATPTEESTEQSTAQAKLVENPINFKKLQKQNEDIYAWIYVPGTKVNYAVLQHPTDNSFYLDHDEDGESAIQGSIFSENYNTKDFQDAVTLLYGHNSNEQAMFSTLHFFEDKKFFKKNKKFYIYAPGHIYTYKIVSAFTTDDRHILYKYKYFQTYEQLREFEEDIQDPHSILQHTRKVKMDDDSKIVVLSTCNTGALSKYGRFIVCGVMTNDRPTQ